MPTPSDTDANGVWAYVLWLVSAIWRGSNGRGKQRKPAVKTEHPICIIVVYEEDGHQYPFWRVEVVVDAGREHELEVTKQNGMTNPVALAPGPHDLNLRYPVWEGGKYHGNGDPIEHRTIPKRIVIAPDDSVVNITIP